MTEKSVVRSLCGVQLNDRRSAKYLMLLLGLSETRIT